MKICSVFWTLSGISFRSVLLMSARPIGLSANHSATYRLDQSEQSWVGVGGLRKQVLNGSAEIPDETKKACGEPRSEITVLRFSCILAVNSRLVVPAQPVDATLCCSLLAGV